MKVLKEIHQNTIRLECIGKIDTGTAPEFRAVTADIDFSGFERVVLDFENVPYISSAGLRELLIIKKKLRLDVPLRIDGASEDVIDIFETTGFADFLEFDRPEREADYCDMSFGAFLASKVQHDDGKTVLSYAGRHYTWTDIDAAASAVAEQLYRLGVRKGAHVGLCGVNAPNWIFAFYAIQKLGAIGQLLNPQLTEAEIVKFVGIGDIHYLCWGETPMISDPAQAGRNIMAGSCVEKILDIRNAVDFSHGEAPDIDHFETNMRPDDAAIMVFTSGSTGTPKGVLLSAYNILSAACSNVDSLHITAEDKACLILPLFHIFGLVAGLCANAIADAEMIIPEDIHTETVIRTVYENGCTILHSVPTLFLAVMKNKHFDAEKFRTLRSTILSGAATTEAQMRTFQEAFPNNHFAASYGMSEMAPISITDYDDSPDRVCNTVGRPVKDIQVRIFNNEAGRVCVPGEVGEIQVQGYNLMTCYYKANLDKQSINADGWMSTGDLGAFDENGYIRFVGRLKELIIRGGENIVPNEIIDALCEEDCIADAKVYGIPDDFFGERVAAAIILSNPEDYDEAALREHLATKLAKFKIPDQFVVYEWFPTLASGKVDAVALKKDLEEKCRK